MIDRIDHDDGRTTFAAPLIGYTLPPAIALAGKETDEERARREARETIANQAATLPERGKDGRINIGPSRHGGSITFVKFQRRLLMDTLASAQRNLAALREHDDDATLGSLAVEIARWEEWLRDAD